jgi:hypothetical protein
LGWVFFATRDSVFTVNRPEGLHTEIPLLGSTGLRLGVIKPYICSICAQCAQAITSHSQRKAPRSLAAPSASRSVLYKPCSIMSSSPGGASTPSGNRFSPITDTDKAGILWIASLLSGIYASLSILIRWYQKRKCFGIDDWVCVVATVRQFPLKLTTSEC